MKICKYEQYINRSAGVWGQELGVKILGKSKKEQQQERQLLSMWHFFCTFYFSNHSNWKHTTLDQKEYAGGLGSASELTVEYVDKEILNQNVLENHKEILNQKASEYVSNFEKK